MSETKWQAREAGVFNADGKCVAATIDFDTARRIVAALEDQAAMAAKIERIAQMAWLSHEMFTAGYDDNYLKGRRDALNEIVTILEAKQNP